VKRVRVTRGRLVAVVLVLAVLAIAVIGVLTTERPGERLDPTSAAPNGARAVTQVLLAQGVRVDVVHTSAQLEQRAVGADSTVLLTRPGLLSVESLRSILRASTASGSLVLVDPSRQVLAALQLPIRERTQSSTEEPVAAACDVAPFAGLTLAAQPGSRAYSSDAGTGCVTGPDGGDLVRTLPALAGVRPSVIVLGTDTALLNARVTTADDAAFALRALGANPRLLWVAADAAHADVSASTPPTAGPWPTWTKPVIYLLMVCLVLLMFWRGRRLGRLVTEPLPVVVPAAETTRSRGQLYRRARDTDRTAEILRIGTRHRLASYLGLSPSVAPEELVRETSRAAARDPREIRDILLAGQVTDDAGLIAMARALQTLERQVRR